MTDNPYPIYIGRQAFSEIANAKNGISIIVLAIVLSSKVSFNASFIILSFLGFFIFFLLVVLVYNLLYLNAISYSITNAEFNLKGGIIARFEKILPYSKIQHTIITRSFMQRIMGLSTVVVQTASPEVVSNYSRNRNQDPFAGSPRIPGLDLEDAKKLRSYIITQVLKSKSGRGI